MRGSLLLPLLLLLCCVPAGAVAAGVTESYEVDATISDDLRWISGTLRAQVRNETDAPLQQLNLWLYPNTFLQEPVGITDVNRSFYAPFGTSPGGIEVDELLVDDRQVVTAPLELDAAPQETALALQLPSPLPAGGSIELALSFRTRVPHRLGPFSRSHGVLTALGGWHPRVATPARRPGERLPLPADWRVRLHVPDGHLALVGGERPGADGTYRLTDREWADLVVRPTHVARLQGPGGTVWPLADGPDREWEKGSEPDPLPLPSAWTGDELARLLEQMDRWGDLQEGLPDPGPIDLVVVPLRSEIAIATPGIVAVSDRAFQVTPLPLFQAFHGAGIARAYFTRRFLPLVRGCEEPALARQVADGLGALFAQRFTDEVLGGTADARGLLGAFDFLPDIDAFLRSPRAAFSHVYFQPISDPIPVRDEPWTFQNRAPRGKLLLGKLRDWLGQQAFEELLQAYLAGEACPLQGAAEAVAGEDLGEFFRAWSESRPREDLRVRILDASRLPDGSWRSVVEVRRIGDAPPEVIETLAWEDDGDLHPLIWRAQAGEASTTFVVEADEPIVRLLVDPRGRVPQSPAEPGEISAVGDRVPARIQLLLTSFSLSYSAADSVLFGSIDFLLRPREAVRRRLGFGASFQRARLGVRTALTFGFGERVDAARYAWNWGVGLSGDYLRPDFGGDATEEGFAVGPSVGLSYDDRPPAISPLRGTAFASGLSFSAGANRGGTSNVYGGFFAGWLRLFPLGPRSAIATRLKANILLGNPPIQEMLPLGGSDAALRGFPLESVLAEHRVIGSVEWRHPVVPDLDVDFGLARLRQISGAAFVDGAYAGQLAELQPGVPEFAFLADAGYGLRFEYDLFGVRPLTLAVDAAVPFNRGSAAPDAPPVVFSVRAAQAFSSP